MANLSLKLAGYFWDHITPLLTGDVVPEGIDLTYDTAHGLGPVADDPTCHGGEASLGRYFIDVSKGDRSYVGLPVFPMFAFRHRCFLVKRGTQISDLKSLEGKRVGMDGWPNSGNTWTKLTLHQAGVDIWKITWVIAPLYGPPDAAHGTVPPGAPENVVSGLPGQVAPRDAAGRRDRRHGRRVHAGRLLLAGQPDRPDDGLQDRRDRRTTRSTATSRPTTSSSCTARWWKRTRGSSRA